MIDIDRIKGSKFSALDNPELRRDLYNLSFNSTVYGEMYYETSSMTDDGKVIMRIEVKSNRIIKGLYKDNVMINATQERFTSIDYAEVIEEFLVKHYNI